MIMIIIIIIIIIIVMMIVVVVIIGTAPWCEAQFALSSSYTYMRKVRCEAPLFDVFLIENGALA